jgi:hypothetical protein
MVIRSAGSSPSVHRAYNLRSNNHPKKDLPERLLWFLVRLYWLWSLAKKILYMAWYREGPPKLIQPRQPDSVQVLMYQRASDSQPMKVAVENNSLAVCGFWVGAVAAVAAVIQIITAFTVH